MEQSERLHLKDKGIIGEVILGKFDPTTLSEQDFQNSPDLLFHGSAKSFSYSPEGNYDRLDTGGDGSEDYGTGFYTTDNKIQAENYSIARSAITLEKPIINSFLPYNARMLDVRNISNPDVNGVLPTPFVIAWEKALTAHMEDENRFAKLNEFIKNAIKSGINEILVNLRTALDENKPIQIRGNYHQPGIFSTHSNGLIASAFRDFMLSQGYDGMIYREGGEGEKREDLTGYVFYNYRVVDTREGWLKRT
jgi:hypothetical protein